MSQPFAVAQVFTGIEGRSAPIHADAPSFVDQSIVPEILETGIKVVDLLAPYARGGKIGLFGGAGVGKTVLIQGQFRDSRSIDFFGVSGTQWLTRVFICRTH